MPSTSSANFPSFSLIMLSFSVLKPRAFTLPYQTTDLSMITAQSLKSGLVVTWKANDTRESTCSSLVEVMIATSMPLALCSFIKETSLLLVTRYNFGEDMTTDCLALAISFANGLKKSIPLKICLSSGVAGKSLISPNSVGCPN